MPNDIKKLRRLMRNANNLKKSNPAILRGATLTQSQALKYAWWFESFRNQLRSGTYRFSYFKTDGSIREAVGTLDLTRIPEQDHPKESLPLQGKREPSPSVFTYYDLYANGDTGGWRSFRLDNFIGFVEQLPTPQTPI